MKPSKRGDDGSQALLAPGPRSHDEHGDLHTDRPPSPVKEPIEPTLSIESGSEDNAAQPDLPLGVTLATYSICFFQGMFASSHVVVQYFLKDDLDLSPVQNQVITLISIWPWGLKFLYGFVSDSTPIYGYRRVPYLIGASLLAAASWGCLAGVEILGDFAPGGVWLFYSLISMGLAIIDVVCDASVVQKVQEFKGDAVFAASIQSRMGMARTCGEVAGLTGGPFLFGLIGTHKYFLISALVCLTHCISAFFLQERPVDPSVRSLSHLAKGRAKAVKATLKEMRLWRPALLVLLMGAAPAAGTALFFYFIEQLQFTPLQISFVAIYKCVLVLLAFFLYRRLLRTSSFRLVFLLAAIMGSCLRSLSFVVIFRLNGTVLPDSLFCIADTGTLTGMMQIALMPIISRAAAGCPRGIEGTVIALLSATVNIANILSEILGASLSTLLRIDDMHFRNLWLLLAISLLISLIPAFLVNLDAFQLPALVPDTKIDVAVTPPSVRSFRSMRSFSENAVAMALNDRSIASRIELSPPTPTIVPTSTSVRPVQPRSTTWLNGPPEQTPNLPMAGWRLPFAVSTQVQVPVPSSRDSSSPNVP